jgi:PGF-CTERM protein
VKTDSNGNELWNRTFGGTEHEEAYSVQQTSDGGYILAGSIGSVSALDYDFWLVKTDSNGNELWNKILKLSAPEGACPVQQTSDGGYIIAGYTRGDVGYTRGDFWLVKTDSNGNELWNKTFGGAEPEWAYSVQQTSDDGYIIAGYKRLMDVSGKDFWLVKTDSNGNKQWDLTLGGINDEIAYSVQQTTDGGYILAGVTASYGAGHGDAWLMKLAGLPTPMLTLTPTPTPSPTVTPVATPTEEERGTEYPVPGFEAIFAIAGLLAVTYLIVRGGK